MSPRHLLAAGVGALLALAISTDAFAQAVLQTVTVRVNPGQESAYTERLAKLQAVMDRVGGGGKLQVWNAMLAGTGAGNTLVAASFPSLAAFAESTTKTQADPEWQKIIAGLPEIRTIVSQGLIEARDGGGPPQPAASGSVLQGVLVRVKPGQLDTYLKRVEALKAVQARLGTSVTTRVWQATLAGENTGMVAVALTHPSLTAYAENTSKIQADPEWQKIIASLDEIRTIASASLFVAP